MSTLLSPRAPARHGGCPPRTGKSLSAPGPPLANGSRGRGRGGDATESAGRSPGPSPSGSGDGGGAAGADVRGWPGRVSRTRAPRLHAPLPDQRARPLPSQPCARPCARPISSGSAPPRPATPLRGDPSSSSRGAGAAPAVTAPSLGPPPLVPPMHLASDLSGWAPGMLA